MGVVAAQCPRDQLQNGEATEGRRRQEPDRCAGLQHGSAAAQRVLRLYPVPHGFADAADSWQCEETCSA